MTDAKATLDLERLQELLDAYGPDPVRFPASERDAAIALIAGDPAARALRDQSLALAHMLDAVPGPLPSPALQRAVAEIPLRHPQLGAFGWFAAWLPFGSPSRALLSAVTLVLLGVLSGVWSADSDSDSSAEMAPAAADEWNDMSALTFATDLDEELQP
jgi:hypothetical protein